MTNVDFNTSVYRRSHMKEPKGAGSWGFFFGQEEMADVMNCWFTPGNTTYTAAKKMAKAEAMRRFGMDAEGTVYVAP